MTGAMRGFGAPQVCFAYESHMDDIAKALGIDPLEIRLLNAFEEGSISPTGQMLHSVVVKESLLQAAAALRLERQRRSAVMKRRGRGIACMWYPIGFTVAANPSAASVKINEDGTATLLTGTVETGPGLADHPGADRGRRSSASPPTTCTSSPPIPTRRRWTPAPSPAAPPTSPATPPGSPPKRPRRSCSTWRRRCSASRPASSRRKDHKIMVKGFPQRNVHIGDVANHARMVISASRRSAAPRSIRRPSRSDPETGQGKPFAHLRLRHADRRSRRRRRDRRGRSPAHRRLARLRHRHQPDAGRRPGRRRHLHGRRLRAAGRDPVRRQRASDQSRT